jgi:hypothetical protein
MNRVEKDEAREQRIDMEITVDAYGAEEHAMGRYYYLDHVLQFPYRARCMTTRRISPLKEGERVQVAGMAPEDECLHEMFVEVVWKDKTLAVPLSQLKGIGVDHETQEAIEDWHYWVARGYEFG